MDTHSWPVWLPIVGLVAVLAAVALVVVLASRGQP